MRFRTMVVIDVFVLLALAIAVWPKSSAVPPDSFLRSTPEMHRVSGKIAAVEESQFALDVLKDKKPSIIHFVVDEKTAVEGKMTVGAQAAVDYRVNGDKMIATRVLITQASGIGTM